MPRLRNMALRFLPWLVVVWATVTVLGGAIYLARHADPPAADHAAKAGLGLCAVSVAIFAGKVARRAAFPPLETRLRPVPTTDRPWGLAASGDIQGPPATGPPIFRLLRVSRT